MGKDLTSDLRRSWLPSPWESQKNTRSMCDREGDPVTSVISEIYQENLHILFIPLYTYPWLQSQPMARWQKWATFSAHGLSPWEAPIPGNSPSLRVCAVLFEWASIFPWEQSRCLSYFGLCLFLSMNSF